MVKVISLLPQVYFEIWQYLDIAEADARQTTLILLWMREIRKN